jgi:hypothetical protein
VQEVPRGQRQEAQLLGGMRAVAVEDKGERHGERLGAVGVKECPWRGGRGTGMDGDGTDGTDGTDGMDAMAL